MGSLLAATVSYLDARASQGTWLVRIEDIDPLREMAGADKAILSTLESHGLYWDEHVTYQSRNATYHEEILQLLVQQQRVYHCPCSRKALDSRSGKHLPGCGYHDGRNISHEKAALRFRLLLTRDSFDDCIQGQTPYVLQPGLDDFILKRKEGFYSYQLAVTSDDSQQKITHVMRGMDLIHSTPLQIALYHALGQTPPVFGHFLLLTDKNRRKLSKQNKAPPLVNENAIQNLRKILHALGMQHPSLAEATTPAALLDVATNLWNRSFVLGKQVSSVSDWGQTTLGGA